jgi:hypothetical protein
MAITMNLGYLKTRVAKLLRRNDLNTEIVEWINYVQRELTDDINFPELRSTVYTTLVANQYTYTVPDDFSREDRIYYLDTTSTPTWGRNLFPLSKKVYDSHGIESSLNTSDPTDGDPLEYVIQGTDIYLYPAPNKAARLELTYYRTPSDMADDGDAPSINTRWRHYLIPMAYYWGMIYLEKEDMNKVLYWESKMKKTIAVVKTRVVRTENRSLQIPIPTTGLETGDRIY